MANIKFSDLAVNPDTLLETPASGDYVLIYDVSEPLDINKIKVIAYGDLVNLAAQSALQALVSGQAAGDIFYASSATALARKAKGTAGQVLRMNAGATAPEWGNSNGLSCYGTISATQVGSSSTVWADMKDSSVTIAVPCISTLIAVASFDITHYTSGTSYFRWSLDGTTQAEIEFEYHVGSICHPVSVIGLKPNVAPGNRICKLQTKVTANSNNARVLSAFVLGFAE